MHKQSQEDYLRAIYYLGEQDASVVRSVDIASYLKITKPSVSRMLKKLVKQKYIEMEPYSGVFFTSKGLRESKKLTYKHRVIEVFLKDILGVEKEYVHEEAHKLEHSVSDNVIEKLAKYLNNPNTCPGGKKIPKI